MTRGFINILSSWKAKSISIYALLHTLTLTRTSLLPRTVHYIEISGWTAMLNQNVHTCVDVWVTEREKEEPFLRTIAVSVQCLFLAQLCIGSLIGAPDMRASLT